jgi:hypothetical protein
VTNLPVEHRSLIGRAHDVEQVSHELHGPTRVVTLICGVVWARRASQRGGE